MQDVALGALTDGNDTVGLLQRAIELVLVDFGI